MEMKNFGLLYSDISVVISEKVDSAWILDKRPGMTL